jgi:hypothetical protein
LHTVSPRCSRVTGGSIVASNDAMSWPVNSPRCRRPELSITSVEAQNSAIASATKPRRNASRAAWACASRSDPPAASASARIRRYVAASGGLRHMPPGRGARPRSSHSSADVRHSDANSSSTPSIVSAIRGSSGNPCSA